MMNADTVTVRPISELDAPFLVDYWCNNSLDYLTSLGVDVKKLPEPSGIENMLLQQLRQPLAYKSAYALIVELASTPIGHCNLNPIEKNFAFIHLHIWDAQQRKKGYGQIMLRKSLLHFFDVLKIDTILSEPYASNPAPHRVLEKVGFKQVKTYQTTPGHINFEQTVIRWQIHRSDCSKLRID